MRIRRIFRTIAFIGSTFLFSQGILAAPNVVAWGDNSQRQTEVPPDLTNAVAISVTYNHSLAITADARALKWGGGQAPVAFPGSNYVAVAAGATDLALHEDGTVWRLGSTGLPTASRQEGLSNIVGIASDGGYVGALGAAWALADNGTVHALGFPILASHAQTMTRVVQVFGNHLALHSLNADGDLIGFSTAAFNQLQAFRSLSNVVTLAGALTFEPSVALTGGGSLKAAPESFQARLTGAAIALAGFSHDLGLTMQGELVAMRWTPWSSAAQPPPLTNVAQIGSGNAHNVALLGWGPPRFAPGVRQRSVTIGMPLNIYAPAFGESPLSYEWRRDGVLLPEQTNSWLHLDSLLESQAGTYEVTARNALGIAVQPHKVAAIPFAVLHPPSDTVALLGFEQVLSVDARGLSLRHQWQREGADLEGVTNAELRFPAVGWADVGRYSVLVSNALGEAGPFVARLDATAVGYTDPARSALLMRPGISNVVQLRSLSALTRSGEAVQWGYPLPGTTRLKFISSNIVAFSGDAALDASGQLEYPLGRFPSGFSNVVAIDGGIALRADGTLDAYAEIAPERALPDGLRDVVAFRTGEVSVAVHGGGTVTTWSDRTADTTFVPPGVSNIIDAAASFAQPMGPPARVVLMDAARSIHIFESQSSVTLPPGELALVELDAAGLTALASDGTLWSLRPFQRKSEWHGLTDLDPLPDGLSHALAVGEGTPLFWPARTNRTGQAGRPLFLNARAVGRMPMLFQWRFNGAELERQTNTFLAVHESGRGDGVYELVASNAEGSTTLTFHVQMLPIPIGLSVSRRLDGGLVIFTRAGSGHALLQSLDLTNWTAMNLPPIATNGGFQFEVPIDFARHRFFRVRSE